MLGLDLNTPVSDQPSGAADYTPDIQEEGERQARGRKLRRGAISAILFSAGLVVGGVLIPPEATDFHLLPTWLFMGGVMGIYLGVAQLRLARQHLAPNADELLQRDPRAPVVYLRPFDADDVDPDPPERFEYLCGEGTFEQALGASEEEQLAVAMNELGPFVAIGKPYDTLPKLGAARIRVSDQEWKAKVAEWVSHAQLIVLRLGFTKGVQWEVAHIVASAPPQKLVLLLPFTPATGYDTFRQQMREHFKRDLPEIERPDWTPPLSVCGLMYFSSGWEPHFVALERPFLNRVSRALDKIGAMGGIRLLALAGPRPLVTLVLLLLQPRNWVTPEYKRAFAPVIQQVGLRWKHSGLVHLLKPIVVVPLLIGLLCALFVQQRRSDAVQALVAQGQLMVSHGDYDQAIREFSNAIQMSPKDESAMVGRGVAYELNGNYAAAIRDLSTAIQMHPKDKRALMGRAYAYQRSENCAAAEIDANAVIAIDPDNELAWQVQCDCGAVSGAFSRAYYCK